MECLTIISICNDFLIGIVGYFLKRLIKQFDDINKKNNERIKLVENKLTSDVMFRTECKDRVQNCSLRISLESIDLIMKEVCEKQTQLRIDLPKSYISKSEYSEDIKELKQWVRELSERIDRLLIRKD